jgi:hypothetical protein
MKITFTDTLGIPEEYAPKPATSSVPEWYKTLESYIGGEKKPTGEGNTTGTIKRCMPVFDAITNGYVLYTYTDVWISQKDGLPWYEWPSFNPIQWHPVEQAPNHPDRNGHQTSYPKWMNPWGIQTPPGYSTLFVQPLHRESIFTILPGVVDTDQYTPAVNFPFVLNNVKFEGLIPAGTPMAQVIPFKRDSWEMNIGSQEDFQNQNKISMRLRTKFFDSYKSQFRQPKEYK